MIADIDEAFEQSRQSFGSRQLGASMDFMSLGSIPNANLNLYRYVDNNPVNYIDSSGNIPIEFSINGKAAVKRVKALVGGMARIATAAKDKALEWIIRIHVRSSRLSDNKKTALDCGANMIAGFLGLEDGMSGDLIGVADSKTSNVGAICRYIGTTARAALSLFGG